jgi:hypothetical protein
VFIADGIRGEALVIAQGEGSRYAFYRGQTWLGPPKDQPQASEQPAPAEASKPMGKGGKDALLENLQLQNSEIQGENTKQLQELYQNPVNEGIGGGFGGGFF